MNDHKPHHTRESIKAQPLAAVQQEFVTAAMSGKFDEATRDKLISTLDSQVSAEARPYYESEKRKALAANKTGEAPHKPSINLPETALLWAINLAHEAKKNGPEFYDSKLWKQFSGSDGAAQTDKERFAFYAATTGLNKDVRISWGELGSSFYFDPTDNNINLDLILALGVGFDIARSVAFHEIGHSQLTKGFGEKMDALDEQIKALQKKGEESSLTQDEYKQMHHLAHERHFRYLVSDEAENNVVDRWTVNQGRRIRKDHILARNSSEAILVEGLMGDRSNLEDMPINRFQNVKSAVRYSFFRNNGYFPDTEEGWRKIGVNPDWITTKDGKSGMAALEELKELCGGKEGVEYLQPNSSDMMMGAVKLAEATMEYSRKRNKRIEEIYDQFFAHIAEKLVEKQDQELSQEMQQQGKDSSGSPSSGGQGSGGRPVKVDGMGEKPGAEPLPDGPDHGKKHTGEVKDADPGQTIGGLENDRAQREAKGESSNPDSPPSAPSKPKQGAGGGFKPAKGVGTTNVKSEPKVGDWSDYQSMAVAYAAEIRNYQALIDQLRARQLEYEARVSPEHTLLPEDGDMRRLDRGKHAQMLKQIFRGRPITEDDAQRFIGDKSSPVPSNIDVVLLLDGSASMHESSDMMGNKYPFPPINAGMHAGCIINEACKSDVIANRHANFYMGLWGNQTPLMLVKPGDDSQEIGRRIAGVKKNHSWGTTLAPSIRHATAQLAEGQKQHARTGSKTGYSHIIVMSDGGISDEKASFETIKTLLENCPMSSVDFVVIDNGKTHMDSLATKLRDKFPGRVGMYHHTSTATVSDGLETLLIDRIQNTPITPTVSNEHKRSTLERAHSAMK